MGRLFIRWVRLNGVFGTKLGSAVLYRKHKEFKGLSPLATSISKGLSNYVRCHRRKRQTLILLKVAVGWLAKITT